MRISNYRCTNEECKLEFEYSKENDLGDFPAMIKCEKCNSDSKRIWGFGAMCVSQGKLGNSQNGYASGCVNHPSSLTGKVKGTKIK